MTKINSLPRDVLQEVLSRVPLRSIRAVWSTCKTWNDLSYDRTFTKKLFGKAIAVKEREFQVVMMMDYKVYLMSVHLHGLHEDVDPSIKSKAKLISLNDSDRTDISISQVFHCDGLLLCINMNFTSVSRLVVWNPCLGQTRLIRPRNAYYKWDRYALGYEKKKNSSLHSHKILRFEDKFDRKHGISEFEIYSFKSDSWKVFKFYGGWNVLFFSLGVSLRGNTYWYARELYSDRRARRGENQIIVFLICFDFTKERFGPRLSLPFHPFQEDAVALSTVKEEQLAVLFQRKYTQRMEIWVTTKIEPKEVSWNKFLVVDMRPLTKLPFQHSTVSFLVDEKNKAAVVFSNRWFKGARTLAYIIGDDGYFKQVDLGQSNRNCYPLVCTYVPSSMQLKQISRVMQQDYRVSTAKDHRIIGFWSFVFSLFLCIFLSCLYYR